MNEPEHVELWEGVNLSLLPAGKFRSCALSVSLLVPLQKETASLYALIPFVLRRGTQKRPSMDAVKEALDLLYGGAVEPAVRKKGETLCIGFTASFLEDRYALEQTRILESAAGLLGEILLNPLTENGAFRPSFVESERTNLINLIRAQKNEKRQYSVSKLIQVMFAEEPFGVDRLGDEEYAAGITPQSLWQAYETLLQTAQVEIYYCGSLPQKVVVGAVREAFSGLAGFARTPARRPALGGVRENSPFVYEEEMDVTQGKLAIGFRAQAGRIWEPEYPAMCLLNVLFGGSTSSKLFLNVREKLSLCYFANSMFERWKGAILVSSGIEFAQYTRARDEILAQLDACRRGDFPGEELEWGRRFLVNNLLSIPDSQGQSEDYYLGQAVAGLRETPEELAARVEAVTLEDVRRAASGVELDTIYFLKGKEAEKGGVV